MMPCLAVALPFKVLMLRRGEACRSPGDVWSCAVKIGDVSCSLQFETLVRQKRKQRELSDQEELLSRQLMSESHRPGFMRIENAMVDFV